MSAEAWSAIGTMLAAGVTSAALVWSVLSWRSAERDRDDEAARTFLVERLLRVGELFAVSVAYSGGPQSRDAGQQLQLVLRTLPDDMATLVRVHFGVSTPESRRRAEEVHPLARWRGHTA
jgi:hypothetical protein